MAETKRMTAEQVVSYLLEEDGLDFLRESLTLGRAAVDGGGGVGAGRRRSRRAGAGGAADASQRLPGADVGDAGGRDRAGDPEAPPRQLLPELPGAAPALASRRWSRSCRRRTSPASRRGRSTRWSSRSGCGSPRARSRGSAPGLDEQVDAFRNRPLEGRYPYLWLDAKVEKVRDGGRVVARRSCSPTRVHESGYREVIGLDVGEAETEAFWRSFLRWPGRARPHRRAARRLRRARRAEEGDRRRCSAAPGSAARVHFLREALGHARREQQPMLAALLRPIFNADDGRAGTRARRRRARAAAQAAAEDRRAARRGRGGPARLLRLPRRPLAEAALDQPARARQPRDRPPHRRRRHLPQRPLADPARRQRRDRAERRMARRPPLPQQPLPGSAPRQKRQDNDREEARELTAA